MSIVRVADVTSGTKEVRVPLSFYGGVFLEADVIGKMGPKEDGGDGADLLVCDIAKASFDFIPDNCQIEVVEVTEMPPEKFRNRLLSRIELDELDALDARDIS